MKNTTCIALFIPTLNPGGAERVTVNLANAFCAQGFQIDLVLLKSSGNFLKYLNPNIRVICLNSSRLLTCIGALIKYLRTNRPAVLLSGMLRPNIVALIASKLSCTGVPVVISEHTTVSYSLTQVSKLSAALLRVQMRAFYRYAEEIIGVSAGVAIDIVEILGANSNAIRIIHNPVIDKDLVSLSFEWPPHPWLLNKTSPVILSVGRLTKAKDYVTLIKSFNIMRSEQDARLIILGEGELRSELKALIAELGLTEFVSMPGYVENPYSYMRQSDLFVLSSQWEGFGNVLVEAMACNVPIVSTNCPSGPAEILEDGKWGTLVPVGNSELLAQAMLRSLKEGRTNFESRVSQFTIEKAASAYLEVLLSAVSKKTKSQFERS